MDISQSHGVEMMRLIIAVALVAIGARTAYYFYFAFALPTPTSVLGLPIGQHTSCRGRGDLGEEVIKPHTPATLDSDIGYFELVIKGRFKYQPGQVEAFGTLTGDTGIAPMFQVARAILENPNDKTNVYLIYANVTFYDILLMSLIILPPFFSDHFKIYYPPQEWDGGVGFISKEMILTHCPSSSL
ncbi:NADH-cytochrome b5 reductase [Citrus sinensis]|nr:NADH-cytochrome b5 reductase [Citrus sinensis]